MRRLVLIAGLAVALLLLAGLGASISLARSVRSKVRARPGSARTATTSSIVFERSLA
ncbi:MAG TPA: hypothetical protein VGH46_09455 [Gaiellaceae bacterium]|jgi:hypothetical protein